MCGPHDCLVLTDRVNHRQLRWPFLADPFKAQQAIDTVRACSGGRIALTGLQTCRVQLSGATGLARL